jgi:hypothetical protein
VFGALGLRRQQQHLVVHTLLASSTKLVFCMVASAGRHQITHVILFQALVMPCLIRCVRVRVPLGWCLSQLSALHSVLGNAHFVSCWDACWFKVVQRIVIHALPAVSDPQQPPAGWSGTRVGTISSIIVASKVSSS